MAKRENFQRIVLDELGILLSPLAEAVQSPEALARLLDEVGWRAENLEQSRLDAVKLAFSAFATAFGRLQALVTAPPTGLRGLADALQTADEVVEAVMGLSVPGTGDALEDLGKDLLGLLTVEYVRLRSPAIEPLFVLLTLLRNHRVRPVLDDTGRIFVRDPHTATSFEPGRLVDLIIDPAAVLRKEYPLPDDPADPGAQTLTDDTADKLFKRLEALGQALGLPAFYGFDPLDGVNFGTPFGNERAARMLTLFLPVAGDIIEETSGFGVGLALDPEVGLVVRPIGVLSFETTLGRWAFRLDTGSRFPGFSVGPPGLILAPDSGADEIRVRLDLTKLPALDAEDQTANPAFHIGSTEGTRLEVQDLGASFHFAFAGASRDYGFLLRAHKGAIVLNSGDGDGFMAKLFPKNSRIEFDLGLGWSNLRGVHFEGSGALDVTYPVSLDIGGVLFVRGIHLTLKLKGDPNPDIQLDVTTTVAAKMGPVFAVVDRLGLRGRLTPAGFTDSAGNEIPPGNLGQFDASIRFKPPTGLGILIDAGSVVGGGFLFFDPVNGQYAGALELKIYSIQVKAFGLVETRLPDGSAGFSFVIVITAEFNPIQIGLGFTLNGVGGLIGIHRRLDSQQLQALVLSGSGADQILFPRDVVANAPLIISTLRVLLPAAEDRYVFGPLGKFGWGSPNLIEGVIGLILELPGPRLALLGEVSANLPKKDKALLVLNMTVAGVLDFPRKLFAIIASLHDSKVVGYAISGDMAMRVLWGDNPNFAVSVGGFHPSFQPPPEFPTLRRVSIDIGASSGNPSITVQGYLAVTSNTAQIGVFAALNAKKAGIKLSADLRLDALFIFSPFSFEVAIAAHVRVTFHGYGIGAGLHGLLSGPSPWRVKGDLCVSVLWWDACLRFDETFGRRERVELPSLDPWLGSEEVIGLKEALEDRRNWNPEPPPGSLNVVSLAEREDEPLDPLGAAVVTQQVCPFNLRLQRFGPVRALGMPTFTLASAKLNGNDVDNFTFVKGPFAPAQFKEMNDTRKLSAPAYERLDGGIRIPGSGTGFKPGSKKEVTLTYTTTVKGGEAGEDPGEHTLSAEHLEGMSGRSAAALHGMRRSGAEAYVDPTAPRRFALADETYVVAEKLNFKNQRGSPATKIETLLAFDEDVAANPALRETHQVMPVFETV